MMEEVRVFEIPATPEILREVANGASPERLQGLDRLAADVIARASGGPFSVYVCSSDGDKAIRDHLAVALSRSIADRIPNALVVDCDFLDPGLSGIIPAPDALGFLDLVLYGSSLGVIAQRTANGTAVIGSGSFAVSRRTPFLIRAFDDAARYLSRSAGCVIFSGPGLDEQGTAHPIAGRVGLPIVVESGSVAGQKISPLASMVAAAKGSLVWSVRLAQPSASPAPPREADFKDRVRPQDETPSPIESDVDEILSSAMTPIGIPSGSGRVEEPEAPRPQAPVLEDTRVAAATGVPYGEETLEERPGNSMLPRLVTTLLAVVVVGFLLWWLYLTKSMREPGEPLLADAESESGERTDSASALAAGEAGTTWEARDSLALLAASGNDPVESALDTLEAGRDTVAVAQETASEPPPRARPSEPIERDLRAPELAAYANQYLVHVSSFRGQAHAQEDADYLQGRGYATVVARVDLGDKGLWYRVYVGPFLTEPEAHAMKIRLDENPRVKSTRVTKVPAPAGAKDES
jgi:cell division septation protein DedD